MKDKNTIKNGNSEKMLSIGIDSKVKKLCIKCYYEQIIRYYGTQEENEKIYEYAKKLIDVSQCIKDENDKVILNALNDNRKYILDCKREDLRKIVKDNGYLDKFIERIKSLPKELYEAYGILHNKDMFWEDFFTSYEEFDHIHIVIRGTLYNKSVNRRAFVVKDILDLIGLKFDEELDKTILDNHAIEVCNNFEQFVRYLTHETKESEVDGKYPYSREEIFTNMDIKDYMSIVETIDKLDKRSITKDDIIMLMKPFRDMGKTLISFEECLNRTCGEYARDYIKSTPTYKKSLIDAYNEGMEIAINERKYIDRICIYIYGQTEIGKTTSVEYLCSKLGYSGDDIYVVRQGTGKYDGLNANHKILFCDDTSLTDILVVADERAVALHRRGSNDRPWVGNLVICTSNKTPKEFFHEDMSTESTLGRMSRFAIVHAREDGRLILERPIMRGSRTDKVYEKKKKTLEYLQIMQESTMYYCSMYKANEEDVLKFNSREENIAVQRGYRDIMDNPFTDFQKEVFKKNNVKEDNYINDLRYLMENYNVDAKTAMNILQSKYMVYDNDIIQKSINKTTSVEWSQTSIADYM